MPAPVGVGLVSYSAYLWHQPLLAFARIRFGELPAAAVLALGAASILLAWPTWAFVERPFRRTAGGSPRRPLAVAAAAIAGLSVLGAAGVLTGGLEGREPLAVRAIRASVSDFNPWRDTCKTGLEQANPTHPVAGCLLDGADDPGPGVAFYGDSHADALQGAMFPLAKQAGLRFYSVTRSACPPVPGLTRTPGGDLRCDDFVRGVEAYVDAAGFGVVVLAARWTAGVAPGPFDNGEGGVDGKPGDFLVPVGARPADDADRARLVVAAYVRTVEDRLAAGHRVVLVYPIPEAGWNVPEELARRRAAAGQPLTLSTPLAAYDARQAAVTRRLRRHRRPPPHPRPPRRPAVPQIVPGRCVNSIGDQPLYFDDNHLNNTGALLLGGGHGGGGGGARAAGDAPAARRRNPALNRTAGDPAMARAERSEPGRRPPVRGARPWSGLPAPVPAATVASRPAVPGWGNRGPRGESFALFPDADVRFAHGRVPAPARARGPSARSTGVETPCSMTCTSRRPTSSPARSSTPRSTRRCTPPRSPTRTPSGASRASASTGSSPTPRSRTPRSTTHNVSIKWFEDGKLNVSDNCLDRHLATRGDQTAIIWECDDPGVAEHITYRQLHDEVSQVRQRPAEARRQEGRPGRPSTCR